MILFLLFLCVLLVTGFVCAKDARRRGKSPVLVALLVLCAFPLGIVLWLLFRPEPLDGSNEKLPFNLENHRVR